MLLTAMIGLPHSGTTSLLLGLLSRTKGRVKDPNGVDMYQAILFRDSVTNSSELKDITDDENKDDFMLLLSLAKFLVTKHYRLPILDSWRMKEFDFSNAFKANQEMCTYFKCFCEKLFKLMEKIEPSNKLKMSLTRSHGFINFFDINVNKAAYEVVTILGRMYKSVILFNVLNLHHYTPERLRESLDLTNKSVYGSKYQHEKSHLMELHRAYEYFIHNVEGTFAFERDRGNALLVGTHADMFSSLAELGDRRQEVSQVILEHAERIQIEKALAYQGVIPISNSPDDYEMLREKYFQLIDDNKSFEEYVPMKFFFLRCFLHSTDKLFITYDELKECAEICHISSSTELETFLALFQKLCSLFYLEKTTPSYVVLQPVKFVKQLECLYSNGEINDHNYHNGILSKQLAKSFWETTGDGSTGLYAFYTSVLISLGLMIPLESDYFMPSIRSEYDTRRPTSESNSLIFLYNVSLIPFHKQCKFVKAFMEAKSDTIALKFKLCSSYNVVEFDCMSNGKHIAVASVRFRCKYLELFITNVTAPRATVTALCSFLKTECIELLHKMCLDSVLRYDLAIVCPESEKDKPDFMIFDTLEEGEHTTVLSCHACLCKHNITSHPARNWVRAAFAGNPKNAIHPNGNWTFLTPCI